MNSLSTKIFFKNNFHKKTPHVLFIDYKISSKVKIY